jgi:hypothetical protein
MEEKMSDAGMNGTMPEAAPEIACRLTDAELRERRNGLLRVVGTAVQETREIDGGLAFRFPADERWLDELATVVRLERRCCPFLTFSIVAGPELGPLWLEITGPAAAREMIATLLA